MGSNLSGLSRFIYFAALLIFTAWAFESASRVDITPSQRMTFILIAFASLGFIFLFRKGRV